MRIVCSQPDGKGSPNLTSSAACNMWTMPHQRSLCNTPLTAIPDYSPQISPFFTHLQIQQAPSSRNEALSWSTGALKKCQYLGWVCAYVASYLTTPTSMLDPGAKSRGWCSSPSKLASFPGPTKERRGPGTHCSRMRGLHGNQVGGSSTRRDEAQTELVYL